MKAVTLVVIPVLVLGCTSSDFEIDSELPAPDLPGITEPGGSESQEPVVCAQANQSFEDLVPTVMLVVDRSASMTRSFGATNRWQAVYQTLMAADGVVTRLQDEVRFGLMLYHSEEGFEGPACPMLDTVAPQRSNAAAIDATFAPLGPVGDTPTGPSMLAAASVLAAEPSPTFVVLATDGLPDTCELPDPDGHAQARADAIAATQQAFAGGAPTYVLSVGPDVAEDHLQAVANAGAGFPPNSDERADYYVALNPDALIDAFGSIMDDVRFCTFTFEEPELADHEEGLVLVGARVVLDGEVLIEGEDWRMVGDDAVQLLGDACDEVLEGGDHQVEAELLCEMRLR